MGIVPASLAAQAARARTAMTRGYISPLVPANYSFLAPKPKLAVPSSNTGLGGGGTQLGGPNIPGASAAVDYSGSTVGQQQPVGPSATGASDPYLLDIKSQPDYGTAETAMTNAQDAARTAYQNQVSQALIGYGSYDPSKISGALSQYGGIVDPTTADAASANQFSTTAQLQRQLSQGQAALPYQLAARGVARSGAATQQNSLMNQNYDLQSNQALSSLLSSLSGYGQNYGSALSNSSLAFEQAKRDIAMRLSMSPGYSQPTDPNGNPLPGPAPPPNGIPLTTPQYLQSIGGGVSPTGPAAVTRANTQAGLGYLSPMPKVQVKAPPPVLPPSLYLGGYGGGGWNYPGMPKKKG
jgi:hypothetical protein